MLFKKFSIKIYFTNRFVIIVEVIRLNFYSPFKQNKMKLIQIQRHCSAFLFLRPSLNTKNVLVLSLVDVRYMDNYLWSDEYKITRSHNGGRLINLIQVLPLDLSLLCLLLENPDLGLHSIICLKNS